MALDPLLDLDLFLGLPRFFMLLDLDLDLFLGLPGFLLDLHLPVERSLTLLPLQGDLDLLLGLGPRFLALRHKPVFLSRTILAPLHLDFLLGDLDFAIYLK